MNNIKVLYYNARENGTAEDIQKYTEAVNNLTSKPSDYVLQLEYIISSNIGLKTFKPFVEKYGFSIPLVEKAITIINESIEKGKNRNSDISLWNESLEWIKEYVKDNVNAFKMYDYYTTEDVDNYIKAYYSNTNGKENRFLIKGMIDKFGESAIPDLLINAKSMNESAVDKLMKYAATYDSSPLFYEWMNTLTEKDYPVITEGCASHIVNNMKERHQQVYKESLLVEEERFYEYSIDEFNAIQDLIAFKENQLLYNGELNTYNEIASLYNEFEGMQLDDAFRESLNTEDVGDNIVGMLPQSKPSKVVRFLKVTDLMEGPWMYAGSHKKTGAVPEYLKYYDMAKYGEKDPKPEDDTNPTPVNDDNSYEEPTTEPSLDDYRRPSAPKPVDDKPANNKPETSVNDDKPTTPSNTPSGVNNYYYYNWHSNNTTHGSYNKDYSQHNDNSAKNDHSYNGTANTNEDDKKFHALESAFNLDPLKIFNEEVGDADDHRPESEHPIRDTAMDIDRAMQKGKQKIKKGIQTVGNAGRAIIKPIKRVKDEADGLMQKMADDDENKMKEDIIDPKKRNGLFSKVKKAIVAGSLWKAGLLLNPIILGLWGLRKYAKFKNYNQLRLEIIGELNTEIDIVNDKIARAEYAAPEEAARLKRFKAQLEKKKMKVAGTSKWQNLINA